MVATASRNVTLERAQKLFARGTDCLGPAEVMTAHGEKLGLRLPETIPGIPWTDSELVAARARDEQLILVPPDLTMKQIVEAHGNQGADGGKLLYDISWYKEEPFYTTAKTAERWHWRLVGKTRIVGSTSENYVGQTGVIAGYLRDTVYGDGNLSDVYRQAIDQFDEKRDELAKLARSNVESEWKKAARELATLRLNNLCRESPAVSLFRLITHLAVNGERLLQGIWNWSPALSSFGLLVSFGRFVGRGAYLYDWYPGSSLGTLGVILSRSSEEVGSE